MPCRTCRVAFPPGGCHSLPSGLDLCSVHSLSSWLSGFLARSPLFFLVLVSPGFPGMLHVLLLSLSLQSCAWFILPLRPVLLGRRCMISSAPQFVGFTVLAVQMRAKSHWETVEFSREVRFPSPLNPTSSALWRAVLPCCP